MPARRKADESNPTAAESDATETPAAEPATAKQRAPRRSRATTAEPESPVVAAADEPAAAKSRDKTRTADEPAAKEAAEQTSRLRVKLIRSTIGHRAGARGTVRALGLHRLHETVEVNDTVENRGMLRRIAFLIEVTEPVPSSSDGGGDR